MSSNFELLGKKVRGRFGFPSGVIATNEDTASYLLDRIPQLGFFVGKSTTLEPEPGNQEDILAQPGPGALWNAVGYANPGLEATCRGFARLKKTAPEGVFLMPQIGEKDEEGFSRCAEAFDSLGDAVDGIELNLSCPHANGGGILIGSDPKIAASMVRAAAAKTKKPLIVKLNAQSPDIVSVAKAVVAAGASAVSAINALGGPNPELSNLYGGLSGKAIFSVTLKFIEKLKASLAVPVIMIGGIRGAEDLRSLGFGRNDFASIGSALIGLSSEDLIRYFALLEEDLANGTDLAPAILQDGKQHMEYHPLVLKDHITLTEDLSLLRFYGELKAGTGQFVFLTTGTGKVKPFSVAKQSPLEFVIRRVGPVTEDLTHLKPGSVVRCRGPYGKTVSLPKSGGTGVFVGAGCGIAPIRNAAEEWKGKKIFLLGARSREELVYLEEFREMGDVFISTDDGSLGMKGRIAELFSKEKSLLEGADFFFNCGPEEALKELDWLESWVIERERIFHLVERMTGCGVGICGKCSTPSGERACVDGPVFSAVTFAPGQYTRDKTGAIVSSSSQSERPKAFQIEN